MNKFEAEVTARSVVMGMGQTFNQEYLETFYFYVGNFGIYLDAYVPPVRPAYEPREPETYAPRKHSRDVLPYRVAKRS